MREIVHQSGPCGNESQHRLFHRYARHYDMWVPHVSSISFLKIPHGGLPLELIRRLASLPSPLHHRPQGPRQAARRPRSAATQHMLGPTPAEPTVMRSTMYRSPNIERPWRRLVARGTCRMGDGASDRGGQRGSCDDGGLDTARRQLVELARWSWRSTRGQSSSAPELEMISKIQKIQKILIFCGKL